MKRISATVPTGLFRGRADPVERPLLDESTLSVIWKGKSLHLGNTLAFRLLERLARCPNQYVTHLDLLRDVWEDETPGHRDHPQPRPATPPQAPRRRLDRSGDRDSGPQRALHSEPVAPWPAIARVSHGHTPPDRTPLVHTALHQGW